MGEDFEPYAMTERAADFQAEFFRQVRIANAKGDNYRACEIAQRAGLTPSYYSRAANLKLALSLESAIRISDVFDLEFKFKIV